MMVVTTDTVPGRTIKETLGLVRGNTVRCRHIGQDIKALVRNMIGGEVVEYTKLMAESREQAIDRMVASAHEIGANAILAIRFSTAEIMSGTAELLVYGTAVILE
jgi:uncharacterized protein YbjQ (UPF0145 family)